jgi:hypothetical protein
MKICYSNIRHVSGYCSISKVLDMNHSLRFALLSLSLLNLMSEYFRVFLFLLHQAKGLQAYGDYSFLNVQTAQAEYLNQLLTQENFAIMMLLKHQYFLLLSLVTTQYCYGHEFQVILSHFFLDELQIRWQLITIYLLF